MRRTASLLLTFALATASVLGHEGHHGAPPPETAAESFWNLVTAVVLVAIALLYAAGLRRLWGTAAGRESVHRWHVLAFAAGWSSLLLALLSQLDRWSDALFSAHMAQHEVLMLVSAPLMVLGRPFVVTLWALSAPARGKAALVLHRRSVTAAWELLSGPLAILILHAAVLGAWHVPSLFEAALHHEAIHVVQHLTFFLTAALFWWSLIHGPCCTSSPPPCSASCSARFSHSDRASGIRRTPHAPRRQDSARFTIRSWPAS
jgi:putative membrane protein